MPDFEINGMDKLKGNLNILKQGVKVAMAQAGYRGGEAIVSRAVEIINENEHIISGTLWRSIHATSEWVGPSLVEISVGTNVYYAPYVEALPDGGYLYRATAEKINEVYDYIFAEWTKLLLGMAL